jgi:hypothetical protein
MRERYGMKNVMTAAAIAAVAISGVMMYDACRRQGGARRLFEEAARENARLTSKTAEQDARIRELASESAAKAERIKELEARVLDLEKRSMATYFLKKASWARTLADGSFEQTIDLEPRGENTIPILSVIAQTRTDARIIELKAEGETIPPKSERESNANGTMARVMYGAVRPAPVRITVRAEKDAPLDVIIDPFREI